MPPKPTMTTGPNTGSRETTGDELHTPCHRSHQHAVQAACGACCRALAMRQRRPAARHRACNVQRHATDLGLVGDVLRGNLEDHRVAVASGGAHASPPGSHHLLPRHADAGRGQRLLGMELVVEHGRIHLVDRPGMQGSGKAGFPSSTQARQPASGCGPECSETPGCRAH